MDTNEMVWAATTLGIDSSELHTLHDVDIDAAYTAKSALQSESEQEGLVRARIVLAERPITQHVKHDCIKRFLKDFKPPRRIAARHLYNEFNAWKSSSSSRLRISEKLFGTVIRATPKEQIQCRRGRQGRWYGFAPAAATEIK